MMIRYPNDPRPYDLSGRTIVLVNFDSLSIHFLVEVLKRSDGSDRKEWNDDDDDEV